LARLRWQRRREVVEIRGGQTHLTPGTQALKWSGFRHGRKQRDRAAVVRHLDGFTRRDSTEKLARTLSEFTNPDARHVLLIAQCPACDLVAGCHATCIFVRREGCWLWHTYSGSEPRPS